MEALKAIERTTTVAGRTLSLTVEASSGRCELVVVKACYGRQRFKQLFRSADFLLPAGESLLFLKLLLQEFEFTEHSIAFLGSKDISLNNTTLGSKAG